MAEDINENGDIVGSVVGSDHASVRQAVLWRDGEVIALGTPASGKPGSLALDINDDGLIVGFGRFTDDVSQAMHALTFSVQPPNTPPTLELPAPMTVDAASPEGVVVLFSATAVDAEDGTFNATCSPASGSLFAIGVTAVWCAAADTGRLITTGSFTITVLGAVEQTVDLQDDVEKAAGTTGVGTSLFTKLQNTLAGLSKKGNCGKLASFISEVTALSGKKLTAAQASGLIADAQRIRAVMDCKGPI